MISFKSDYAQGAHPRILQALQNANAEHNDSYCFDAHCTRAVELIRQRLGQDHFVTFMPGGTVANLTVISHFLRQHQAVISAVTGHVFTHETGAIEATGHKVVACPSNDGKLTPALIQNALDEHHHVPYTVQPKMVYISQTTEWGTVYTKDELTAISRFCREHELYLYMDGARLGCALAALGGELTLADLADMTDAFTIGGTKNGALFGEAVVIPNAALAQDFKFSMRQKGGLLARGCVLGIQFEELFSDDLYIELAAHANRMAKILADGLTKAGYKFHVQPQTNQLFVHIENNLLKRLSERYMITVWEKSETHTLVRLMTSWAIKEEDVREFLAQL